VAGTTTETIQVAADTKAMRVKIDDFITKFNEVQEYLETATKISPDGKGKVTTGILADNREIQDWGRSMRNMAFSAVSGMAGTITRLESLGIDFKSGTNNLEVKDSTKLEAALRDKPAEVDAFFHTATTGFAAKFKTFLTTVGTLNTTKQSNLNKNNAGLDTQIGDLERRLTQQRSMLESAFIAMESAQQKLQSQQAALSNAFKTSS
jgi:flagellar hook-associated protein 2